MEDIENEIPENRLIYSQNSSELRVKTISKDENGFTETKISRIPQQQKQINVARPFSRTQLIENTICLSIEDLTRAKAVQDCCWEVFKDVFFRRVLIYGKVVVINKSTRDNKTWYNLSIDDGSGVITGFLNLRNEVKTQVANLSGRLTTEKNKLKRKEEVGVNIAGFFYPSESLQCQTFLNSCRTLHNVINKNLKERRLVLDQGPLAEKALVFGNLYTNNQNGNIQFNVIDISPNDSLELSWKRQLNKLYLKNYLKCA